MKSPPSWVGPTVALALAWAAGCTTAPLGAPGPLTCPLSENPCWGSGSVDATAGRCVYPNLPDGTACDDHNACTSGESCRAGRCTPAQEVQCPAPTQCHRPSLCNPATGACSDSVPDFDGALCDDHDECSLGEKCTAGVCGGGNARRCPVKPCFGASCNPATGRCGSASPLADGTACNDGDPCTDGDVCQSQTCAGVPRTLPQGASCGAWRHGWDDFDQRIDLTESFVSWHNPAGTHDLVVRYRLEGAVAKSRHIIGVDSFTSPARCLGTFGQVAAGGCSMQVTREKVTVTSVENFDAATVVVDADGTGDQEFTFSGVATGSYDLEFHVRIDDFNAPGCPGCAIIYESPGPFGTTAPVSMP